MVDGDTMKNKIKGTIYLLLATVIWGSAFIAQSMGMDHVGPFTFQAVRCGLACLFLFPLSRFTDGKANFRQKWMNPKLWKTGILAGLALFLAAGLQQVSLQYTAAGKAGFLTAMYIVLVPVLGTFLGEKPSPAIWISVGIAVLGLYLLSGADLKGVQAADLMLLGCAFFFAVQITIVDRLGLGFDGVRLNFVQSLVCALLSAITMALTEEVIWANILRCWVPLCYAGILSMGVAYTLQIIGQQKLDPTQASILMSLESVFALLFGWLLLHEHLSPAELTGCGAMFCAVILSQIPKKAPH
jgi:drug/metabolite transporter (DMT)-like permease